MVKAEGRGRAMLFLYSTRNIAGSVLGLIGVALFFLGVIDRFWLPIVIGLYGVGFLAAPGRSAPLLTVGGAQTAEEVNKAMQTLAASIKGRVEADVAARVSSIVGAITDALPRLARGEGQLSDALFTVRQMALDYLPNTLNAYVKLPPAYRRLHALSNGKTAHDVLTEQLSLLDTKMQEILVSVNENDTQALLANGRFLQEKFAAPGFHVG